MYFLEQSLIMYKEIGDLTNIAKSYINLGVESIDQNKPKEAISYCLKAIDLSEKLGNKENTKAAYETLAMAYKHTGQYKEAYEAHNKYTDVALKIFSEAESKNLGKLEGKHESEMAQIQKEYQAKEAARIAEQQLKRRNNLITNWIFIGIILLVVLIFFSGRFVLTPRITEAAVFFIMILFFEFIMVLLDPIIENYSAQ